MTRHRLLARLVALLTMLGVAVLLFVAVIAPLAQWRSPTLSNLDKAQAEQHRLMASIARLNQEKQSFVADDLGDLIWAGAQSAEATARVQSAVNDMARNSGIVMRSIAPANTGNADMPNAKSFRLEFEATLDQLVPFLKNLEFGQPSLIITRASLRRLVRPNQSNPQPALFAQIDIAAPMRLKDEAGEE
jgi:type II secretory pathway component PulM